jgi:putative heme-binding domain-containing protein
MAGGLLLAQHEYTAADIDNGGLLYRNNCMVCHGPDGNQVAGLDLLRGKFSKAVTDEDLVRVIRTGHPGTPMPANNLLEAQASNIVAYLRSNAAAAARTSVIQGDPTRGRALLESKGGCLNCHRVKGQGSRLAPDLSDVGALRRQVEIEASILDPGATVLPQHRFIRVTPRSGAAVTGRLLNQDSFTVQLIDGQNQLRSFAKSDLRELTIIKESQMPSYKGKLSSQEVADVVSYLVSLKGNN